VKRQETMVKNVIGYLEGSGPLADETIVVGAHYDHLGYGFGFGSLGGKGAKGKIHHGADDNGSGSTTVIELARRFGAMKEREGRRMVFMTFTAEERGLIGSRHYCKVEPLFPLKNTAAMVNLDMVGRVNPRITRIDDKTVTIADEDGKAVRTYDLAKNCEFYRQVKGAKQKFTDGLKADEYKKVLSNGLSAALVTDAKNQVTKITLTGEPTLFALGMDTSPGFEDLVKKHNPGFEILLDMTVFGASDHYEFYRKDIPVLFFFTGLHQDYHRPTDTSDKINVAGMKRVADMSERIISELSTDPKRPEFIPIKSTFTPGGTGGVRIGFQPDMGYNGKGVRVDAVSAKGPADQAGIKTGDIIIELAGKETPNLIAYQKIRETLKGGVAIEIKVLRDTKELTFKVTPAASK
jgi:Peptidase family M28/PDZ domain